MISNLQIISGKYRGRRLALPTGARPTQNRARIALFNMLESGIIDASKQMTVWDAFAGSGAFGTECLSRYNNASVIFTDVSPDSIKTVKKNLGTIGATALVGQTDAIGGIRKHGATADLIFIDPPYTENSLGSSFVRKIARVARPGTILVWEIEDAVMSVPELSEWTILRDKTYGRARFLILAKN